MWNVDVCFVVLVDVWFGRVNYIWSYYGRVSRYDVLGKEDFYLMRVKLYKVGLRVVVEKRGRELIGNGFWIF